MRLSFYGACREVTGSNFLLEVAGKKILLECGFFQGYELAEKRNYSPFQFDPKSVDAVIIGHAHLDHTGRLPKLVKDGFRGTIYATAPTKELTGLVLEDSQKLMREEADRNNHPPLFNEKHVNSVLALFECIPYNQRLEIASGITITFKNAGHILGSSILVLETNGQRLVYTGDLGNVPCELLSPPETVGEADYVLCETTYGGRIHEDAHQRHEKLNRIIKSTIAEGGVLMIPSFAIERTQELLHDIEHFCTTNNCSIPTFYLDSPLAAKVTKVFEKYPDYLNPQIVKVHKQKNIFSLQRLKITSTVEESKQINEAPAPKIIIAGSGMINGGRILYHLIRYISDPKNTLLIVGYQAVGTLGRKLLEGASRIKIFDQNYHVKANVLAIGSYSAHADGPQLLKWVNSINKVKKMFLVHGEANQSLAFSKIVKERLNIESIIPQQGETYDL